MGSVLKFAAVNAKVKALEGKFLTSEQYKKLMECSSYIEAVRFLREETPYSSLLSNYNPDEIHRGQLETILKRNYVDKFIKFRHYFTGNYKKLFNILFMRLEIEDLKVIIRGKYVGRDSKEICALLCAETPLNNMDYEKLLSAKDVEGVAENLKGTIYYEKLSKLAHSVKEEGLFRIETSLDFMYFQALRKISKKISKDDREILQKIVGTYSDLLNIQWIYRGKKYYNISSEELFNYTIYDSCKLKREDIKKLCYCKDEDSFFEVINAFPYAEVFNRDNTEYLTERNILVYLKNMFDYYKRENKLNISSVIAYLELLQIETRDIISIIENLRYEMNVNETSKYIAAAIEV